MKKKLKRILLIDDDVNTNLYNKIVISQLEITEEIIVCENGKEAIDYLTNKQNTSFPQPEMVFLDINMPVMNGWEFLEAYNQLDEDQKAQLIIAMLTSSLNPDDKTRAQKYGEVKEYISKPLNGELVMKLYHKYFSEDKAT